MDLDYEVRQNFFHRLPDTVPALVGSYFPDERTQNSLMSSPPHHPFWNATWARMQSQLDRGCVLAVDCTGPQVLEYLVDLFPESIVVLPCEIFMPVAIGESAGVFHPMLRYERLLFYKLGWYRKCGAERSASEEPCVQAVHHSVASTAGMYT